MSNKTYDQSSLAEQDDDSNASSSSIVIDIDDELPDSALPMDTSSLEIGRGGDQLPTESPFDRSGM